MRCSVARSTVRAARARRGQRGLRAQHGLRARRSLLPHALGWLLALLCAFSASPGLSTTDTKLDLLINPGGFLRGALHIWTDVFPLGQLHNQAYGYLFPQGLFFWLLSPLPGWMTERLWWTLLLGLGFSGMLQVLRRLGVGTEPTRLLAAALFALSPRTLTTLTAISSEAWPIMLAPWAMYPLLKGPLPRWREVGLSLLPIAAMGAVNATATLAACIPAGAILLARSRRWLLAWLAGCAAVSAWWIGPLLILGRYSPPFIDFIESSRVTTRWLNLAEILRGTTSWAPFADEERRAGVLLVTEPVFIVATMAIAALGLWGLARAGRTRQLPLRHLWLLLLAAGVLIMGFSAPWWLDVLDGPGAALRNVHKFDLLVRIPLLIGVASIPWPQRWRLPELTHPSARHCAAALIILVALAAVAPAWTGRLAHRGAWEDIPEEWVQATRLINEEASGTRTLIYPPAHAARQTWGWTRDEPAQPLLDVPWAVRDAIPLVPPEAIRGLDGLDAMLHLDPRAAVRDLPRLGIGAVILRSDLDDSRSRATARRLMRALPGEHHRFGDLDVVLIDRHADALLAPADSVDTVSGGGESLALLNSIEDYRPRRLVDAGAQTLTDTPMPSEHNYGEGRSGQSAPLAAGESGGVLNAVKDYPSAGARPSVRSKGGSVVASTSASNADSFGGAQPAHSPTAAVDHDPHTSWLPAPGTGAGQWLELRPDVPVAGAELELTATEDTELTIHHGGESVRVELQRATPRAVRLPGADGTPVRIELHERVGIAEAHIRGHDITRTITLPDSSPNAHTILLQRLWPDTGVIIRRLTLSDPRELRILLPIERARVSIDGREYRSGDTLTLPAGEHEFRSTAAWVYAGPPAPESAAAPVPLESLPDDGHLTPAEHDRLLITTRAANPGLRGELSGVPLEPRTVDASTQAFLIPAGASGTFSLHHVADTAYRTCLLLGGILAGVLCLGIILACLIIRPTPAGEYRLRETPSRWRGPLTLGLVGAVLLLLSGWVGAVAGVAAWLIERFTLIRGHWLAAISVLLSGVWLAHASWPMPHYAGDHPLLTGMCALGLAACAISMARGGSGRDRSAGEGRRENPSAAGRGTPRGDEAPPEGSSPAGRARGE